MVKNYLPILFDDTCIKTTLQQGCRFVSRRPPTIGNTLSPSLFTHSAVSKQKPWLKYAGFTKCGSSRCRTCHHVLNTKVFSDATEQQTFPIKTYINCNTMYTVYIVECTECKLKYVGSTIRKFKTRILEHLN